jgi:ureidoacrylate peracid hydrolase
MEVRLMTEATRKKITKWVALLKSALLVVDVQNDFCSPEGVFGKREFDLAHVENAIDSLESFLRWWRSRNWPVIFIRTIHSEWTDSDSWLDRIEGSGREMKICRPDTWGAEFYRVTPQLNDLVVTKHRFSGFVGTDLNLVLRARGIESLCMTGVTTNVCVESTARDGFNLDFRILLVEDCCGAFSVEEHRASVHNIGRYFGLTAEWKAVRDILESQFQERGM